MRFLQGNGMRLHWLTAGLLACVLSSLPACQADAPPASKPTTIPIANKADLQKSLGKTVLVRGKVSRAGKSSSGHVFLNFSSNPQFTVFIESKTVGKFEKIDPSRDFTGKTVTISGRLEKYRDKIQLKLSSPESITVSEEKTGRNEDELPKAVELKSIGKDSWLSPAGLMYIGRDPEGLTRKEHVLRHAKNQPDRAGPHGVFDGGEKLAFAWIDLAWGKIRADKIRPREEGSRETYLVSMGRRVGYLGGKTGAERKNPPLTKIFIVVRKGTREVITAFPR